MDFPLSKRHTMTETQPWNYPWEITANGVLIEGWKPFDLPSSSSASSLSSLASTSSLCSCLRKEMVDKGTQTQKDEDPTIHLVSNPCE